MAITEKVFFDDVGEIGSTSKMTNFPKNSALKKNLKKN